MNVISKKTEDKIKKGETWNFSLSLDNDVAKKVLADAKKPTQGVVLINKLINNKLRKAYGLKQK